MTLDEKTAIRAARPRLVQNGGAAAAADPRPAELPEEVRELILEMADQVKTLNIKLHGVVGELDAMKALEIIDTSKLRGAA